MNNPRRGEVWLVNFDPQVGDEIRKSRPAIVVSANDQTRLELRIIVPVTDWKEQYQHHWTKVHLTPDQANALSKESAADCFQIRCVSLRRFTGTVPIGRLTPTQMQDVAAAIRIATAMDE